MDNYLTLFKKYIMCTSTKNFKHEVSNVVPISINPVKFDPHFNDS